MNRAIETTATMIDEIALIWSVTPELDRAVDEDRQRGRADAGVERGHHEVVQREGEREHRSGEDGGQDQRHGHVAERDASLDLGLLDAPPIELAEPGNDLEIRRPKAMFSATSRCGNRA